MLILTRRVGESIQIGDLALVTVVRITEGSVRLGIRAPLDVAVMREELLANPPTPAVTETTEASHD
jgi:carbon storage regulator